MPSLRLISAPAPFGPPILCALERQQVRAERLEIERDAARRLHGIDMQHAAMAMHDVGRLRAPAGSRRSRCWRAISETSARCRRKGFEPLRQRRQIDRAVGIDGNLLDPGRTNRPPASTDGCSIADTSRRSNGRLSSAICNRRRQCERIRLGSARCEDDIARIGADQRRDLLARLLDRMPRRAAFAVDRGRIADAVPARRETPPAPAAGAVCSHSSLDRARAAIDSRSDKSTFRHTNPKDLLFALEIVQTGPATPARFRAAGSHGEAVPEIRTVLNSYARLPFPSSAP